MHLPIAPRSADIYGLLYTPLERRRLARADSGLGRRAARRVSRAKERADFTRAGITRLALIAGAKSVELIEPAPGHVVVKVPAASVRDVAVRLRDVCPFGIQLDVEAA